MDCIRDDYAPKGVTENNQKPSFLPAPSHLEFELHPKPMRSLAARKVVHLKLCQLYPRVCGFTDCGDVNVNMEKGEMHQTSLSPKGTWLVAQNSVSHFEKLGRIRKVKTFSGRPGKTVVTTATEKEEGTHTREFWLKAIDQPIAVGSSRRSTAMS